MKKLHILTISLLALGQGLAIADVCAPAGDTLPEVQLQVVNHSGHGGKVVQVNGSVSLPKGMAVVGSPSSFTVGQDEMATLFLGFDESILYWNANNQECARDMDAQQPASLTLTDNSGNKIYSAVVTYNMADQNAKPAAQITFSAGKPYGFPIDFDGGDAQIQVYTNGVQQSSK